MMVEEIKNHTPCAGLAASLRAAFCENEAEVSWRTDVYSPVVKVKVILIYGYYSAIPLEPYLLRDPILPPTP